MAKLEQLRVDFTTWEQVSRGADFALQKHA